MNGPLAVEKKKRKATVRRQRQRQEPARQAEKVKQVALTDVDAGREQQETQDRIRELHDILSVRPHVLSGDATGMVS